MLCICSENINAKVNNLCKNIFQQILHDVGLRSIVILGAGNCGKAVLEVIESAGLLSFLMLLRCEVYN